MPSLKILFKLFALSKEFQVIRLGRKRLKVTNELAYCTKTYIASTECHK